MLPRRRQEHADEPEELDALDDVEYAVYLDRVIFCTDTLGMTLKDARHVARTDVPKSYLRALRFTKKCPPEMIARIVA